ncbi:MAG: DNAase, partial [Desulfobacterales bacterium]
LLNTPANLHGIINIAAQRRNMAFEALADVGYRNALHLFAPIMQD